MCEHGGSLLWHEERLEEVGEVIDIRPLEVGTDRVEVFHSRTLDRDWQESVSCREVVDAGSGRAAVSVDERVNFDQFAVDIRCNPADLIVKERDIFIGSQGIKLLDVSGQAIGEGFAAGGHILVPDSSEVSERHVHRDLPCLWTPEPPGEIRPDPSEQHTMDIQDHRKIEDAIARSYRQPSLDSSLTEGEGCCRRGLTLQRIVPVNTLKWWGE